MLHLFTPCWLGVCFCCVDELSGKSPQCRTSCMLDAFLQVFWRKIMWHWIPPPHTNRCFLPLFTQRSVPRHYLQIKSKLSMLWHSFGGSIKMWVFRLLNLRVSFCLKALFTILSRLIYFIALCHWYTYSGTHQYSLKNHLKLAVFK